MNSNPKNSLEFAASGMDEYAGNTILEVLQEKSIEDHSSKYVLIKHDYYSTDSDHGRDMLSCFLDGLCGSSGKTVTVYLVDKGTLLLERSNPLFEKISINSFSVVDAFVYGVEIDENPKIEIHSMRSIAEDLVCLPGILTLE